MATLEQVIAGKGWLSDQLTLTVESVSEGVATVWCTFDPVDEAGDQRENAAEWDAWPLLEVTSDFLMIRPFTLERDERSSIRFAQKYQSIQSIVLSPFKSKGHYSIPEDKFDAEYLLAQLPPLFERELKEGLGFKKNDRFIASEIGKIPVVTIIWVHGGDDPPYVDQDVYVVALNRLKQLATGMRTITSRYQSYSRRERQDLAYTQLLTAANDKLFPKRERRLRPNVVVDLIPVSGVKSKLSSSDRRAAVKLVIDNAEELAKTDTHTLFELHADIERLTLVELINKFEVMLDEDHSEPRWQAFFASNPFILSLAFAVPMVYLGGTPYVGGKMFEGGGEKFSDFLFKAASTENLALIEIKKPKSKLLESYRVGQKGPSSDLTGAITQVLDQRNKLTMEFYTLKGRSGPRYQNIRSSSIQCVVLSGTTPLHTDDQNSLEIFRNAIRDVTVITFDELLLRLKSIYDVLSAEPQCDVPF